MPSAISPPDTRLVVERTTLNPGETIGILLRIASSAVSSRAVWDTETFAWSVSSGSIAAYPRNTLSSSWGALVTAPNTAGQFTVTCRITLRGTGVTANTNTSTTITETLTLVVRAAAVDYGTPTRGPTNVPPNDTYASGYNFITDLATGYTPGRTITYAFPTQDVTIAGRSPTFLSGSLESATSDAWTFQRKGFMDMSRIALFDWMRFVNVNFEEIDDPSGATANLLFMRNDITSQSEFKATSSINRSFIGYAERVSSASSTFSRYASIHEVGHLLGLGHPQEFGYGELNDAVMEYPENVSFVDPFGDADAHLAHGADNSYLADHIGALHVWGPRGGCRVAPDVVTNVALAAVGSNLRLTFEPPVINGGSAITSYKVEWWKNSNPRVTRDHVGGGELVRTDTIAAGTGTHTATFNGPGDGDWTAQIVAVNMFGDGLRIRAPAINVGIRSASGALSTPPNAAPAFVSASSDEQVWEAFSTVDFPLPRASGVPAPSYTMTGAPNGSDFDRVHRRIFGAALYGSRTIGTATLTAKNSSGVAVHTVPWVVNAPQLARTYSRTATLTKASDVLSAARVSAEGDLDFPALWTASQFPSAVGRLELSGRQSGVNRALIQFLVPTFIPTDPPIPGRLHGRVAGNITLTITIGNRSLTLNGVGNASHWNPFPTIRGYNWTPSNVANMVAFVRATSDGDHTATIQMSIPEPTHTDVTANAGIDKSVRQGSQVSIGGVDTVLRGQGATTIAWTRVSGTGGSLSSASIAVPIFTAPTLQTSDGDRAIVWRKTVTNNGVTDTDEVTVTVKAPAAAPTVKAFGSISDFAREFNAQTGTGGRWSHDSSGSSRTANTGPGTNNTLPYVHTEITGAISITEAEGRGPAEFRIVPEGTGRSVRLQLCIQGDFDAAGGEGLAVEGRATDSDAWSQIQLIRGWSYSNSYTTNDTITDDGGVDQTCVADGGWIDFDVAIPDSFNQVRLRPRYTLAQGESVFRHDVAFREFLWSISGQATDLSPSFQSSQSDLTHMVGERITDVQLPVATGGTPPLTYTISGLPAGLSFDEITRTISGTPTVAQPSTPVTLTVTSNTGLTGTLLFNISVAAAAVLQGTDGSRVQSFSATPFTNRVPLGIPSAVRNLAESATTISSITWGWDAPNTGGAIASYEYRTAQGSTAFSGSWISTGTRRSVTISSLDASNTYRIQVRARNASGASAPTTDSAETLALPTVNAAVTVGDATPVVGDAVTFTCTVTGTATGTVSYQWQRQSGSNWNNISGATNSTYNHTESSAGTVTVRVQVTRQGVTTTSSSVSATWSAAPPQITFTVSISGPTTRTSGQSASYSATLGGTATGTVSYQWQRRSGTSGNWSNVGTGVVYSQTQTSAGTWQVRLQATRQGVSATSNVVTTVWREASSDGSFSWQLLIGGVDYIGFADYQTITPTDSIRDRSDTLNGVQITIDFNGNTPEIAVPQELQTVELIRDGTKEFSGIILRVDEALVVGDSSTNERSRGIYQLTCADYTRWLDRRLIVEDYPRQTAQARIRQIISSFTDGFTTNNVQGAIEIAEQRYEYQKISSALDQMGALLNHIWFVDFDRDLHFVPAESVKAPIPIVNLDDKLNLQINNIEITGFSDQVINRVYVKDARTRSDNTYRSDTYTADGSTSFWPLDYDPANISEFRATFNRGTPQEVVYSALQGNLKLDIVDNEPGSAPDPMGPAEMYLCLDNRGCRIASNHVPPAGTTVDFDYKTLTDRVVVVEDPTSIELVKAREGGDSSGIYEAVISAPQLVDVSVNAVEAFGEQLLLRQAFPGKSGTFQVYGAGWQAGQTFTLRSTRHHGSIELTMYILEVTKEIQENNTLLNYVAFSESLWVD